MKKKVLHFVGGFVLMFSVFESTAQTMLDSVFVEKYHIATKTDNDADPNLPIGAVTYRVYIDMKPGYKLQSVYGDVNHVLTFKSSTSFYNSPGGSNYANNINKPSGVDLYDSWISLGTDSKGNVAIPLKENSAGKIAGTIASITTTSQTIDDAITASFDTQPGNGTFSINGDAYANPSAVSGSSASNSILIGQFTTDGTFSYALNFQLGNTTGDAEVYVSNNPNSLTDGRFGEYSVSSLVGSIAPNIAPTVSISTSTTAFVGDALTINATATDDNKVSKVEFFVDGTSISSSTTSPYTASWIAITGTHSITAVATDNDGASTTSTAVSVVVVAPTLSIPSTASLSKDGTAGTIAVTSNTIWTASTTDSWLTITPTSGTNSGTITLDANANTGNLRTATVTITVGTGTSAITKTITVTQDGATAVADIKSDIFVISPNPAKAFFSINSLGTTTILIYSLTGELVLNTTISGDEKVNINSLSSGLYLVKIITNNSEQTHKLIVE